MNIIADLHCHTLVSKHALNSVTEMARRAHERALFAIAITDHGPEGSDGGHPWYFWMLGCQPDVMENIFVIKGIEANITDISGRLDCEFKEFKPDLMIASLHGDFFKKLDFEQATQLWLNVAQDERVDIIGHSEEQRFFYDYDRVTKVFAQRGKVVEVNANSCTARPGNEQNLKSLLQACKKNGTHIAVNSDAHSIYKLGDFSPVMPILGEVNFPPELVVNSSRQRLLEMFKTHNPPLYQRILEYDNAFI